jgi:hypothetical protein
LDVNSVLWVEGLVFLLGHVSSFVLVPVAVNFDCSACNCS